MSIKVEEEGVKCEKLERIVIGDNEEKFFQVGFCCLLGRRKS